MPNPFRRNNSVAPTVPPTAPPTHVATDSESKRKRRMLDLYQQVSNVVKTGKGVVRRSKRGVISYGRSKGSGIQARNFWTFVVVGGAVIAVGAAAAFAVIGWWALIPGVFVGIIVALLTYYFSKKWTKKTVTNWLTKLDKQLETNPNYLPSINLTEDGPKVEAILSILVNDHERFEKKIKKYYGDKGEAKARRRLKRAFDQSRGRSDLSTSLTKIKGSKADFSYKYGDDVTKLAILIARERTYIKFTYKYMIKLKKEIKKYYEFLPDVDNAVNLFVERQIGLHPHHDNCDNNCCFGPSESDVRIRTAGRAELQNLMRSGAEVGTKATAYAKSQRRRNRVVDPGTDELLDDIDDSESVVEDAVTNAIEHGTALGVAAISEALEGTLPTALAESAGGTAADLLLAPVGWVVGIMVNEAIQSFTVNRPVVKRTGNIRQALKSEDGQQLDDDIVAAVKKGKVDMLQRALNKIHNNYLKRMSDRYKKLEKAYQGIQTAPANPNSANVDWPYTCTDAVNMTRYMLKLYHYCEKAYSHIIFVQTAVEVIERRLTQLEAISNRAP